MTYRLAENDGILRIADRAWIPSHPENPDYIEYLQWVEAGNQPGPALPPPPPGPDYLAFWNALLVSSVYGSIREQSFASLPINTFATEFLAFISDAKAGRPNEAGIQATMTAILTTGTFAPEDLTELQAVLEAGNLQGIYQVPTPTP